jgi:HAD superfamily hydrolase (TIGR01549 family)
MSKPITAIFFDIGGTLVTKANFPQRDQAVITQMVELLGEDCTSLELEKRILEGDARYKTWRSQTLQELSPTEKWSRFLLPDLPQELVKQHASQLQLLWSESRGTRKVPEKTATTLKELDRRGYLLGTISHTSPKHLAPAGVLHLFKTIIHSPEFGVRKPHPAPFVEAARRSGVLPEQCAYVGDRPSRDVIGAREAGFGMVIQLSLSAELTETDPCPMWPDIVIEQIPDLLGIFPRIEPAQVMKSTILQEPPLYDAALSSMWWNKPEMSADEFCSLGRKLGFARFELNHQVPPEALEQINVGVFHMGSLHDPCPAIIPNKTLELTDQQITSLDENLRSLAVEGMKNTIQEAYNLGARHVVIHPGRIAGDHSLDNELRQLYREGLTATVQYKEIQQQVIADRAKRSQPHLEMLIKSLREIILFAEGKSITLGLENRYHYYELPIYNELEVLLQEFQQPWVGWHLDVGHLYTLSELGLTQIEPWLKNFGSRITGVHLHDIRGITDHQAPGKGDADFLRIAAALPHHCYRTVEVDKSATIEEMADGLRILVNAGCITQLSGGNHA